MPLDVARLSAQRFSREMGWNRRDAVIYALATGHGRMVGQDRDLDEVCEERLGVAPPFLTVLARNAMPNLGELGGDYPRAVLAGVDVRFGDALPAEGTARSTSRICAIRDLGAAKGALVATETTLSSDDHDLGTVTITVHARGDGGCGNLGMIAGRDAPPRERSNHRAAIAIRPEQALLYRLLGDLNPLHVDPRTARQSGFRAPILHGLCTFGSVFAPLAAGRGIRAMRMAFAAPVYPGFDLHLDSWERDGGRFFELRTTDERAELVGSGALDFQ